MDVTKRMRLYQTVTRIVQGKSRQQRRRDPRKNFRHFFTTPLRTKGSGLGLAIVYHLVTRKLKGEIMIDAD